MSQRFVVVVALLAAGLLQAATAHLYVCVRGGKERFEEERMSAIWKAMLVNLIPSGTGAPAWKGQPVIVNQKEGAQPSTVICLRISCTTVGNSASRSRFKTCSHRQAKLPAPS